MNIEDFEQFLDSIYYEGYAEKLAAEQPGQFNSQFSNYLNQYGHERE